MEAHEFVKQTHEAFPTVIRRAALITGKTEELYRSHAREPKTRNPEQSGNVSAVTHYIEYCHLMQAAEKGAGEFLCNRVHASLNADFREFDGVIQPELEEEIVDEGCDVQKWLIKHNLDSASARELKNFEGELMDNIEKLQEALGKTRAMRRIRELENRSGLRRVNAAA